jgi:DNA-binding PadR family transcriptional regulator
MTGRDVGQRRGTGVRGSQRARRGAVRDALLVALAERPMHGYELITELEVRTSGRWRPSPGSIYPALTRMEEEGLLTAEELNGKRVFSLTARGREAREALDADGADPTPDPWRESGDGQGALRALPAEIAGQARQLRRFGSPDQVERAAALLEDVKRELYGILANAPIRDEHAEGTGT